jgi:hypothetical protein
MIPDKNLKWSATMKKTVMNKKKEKAAAKKDDAGRDWTDPMSGPVFRTWGFELFRGI